MCNRVDNEGISIDEVSERLQAQIVEGNYQFAKEVNAFNRPALPIVLDHQGRKITHGTWGIRIFPKIGPPRELIILRKRLIPSTGIMRIIGV